MSHITCPFCGSNEHITGYGLAAGPMAGYTFCESCDELIELTIDMDGVDDATLERLQKMQAEFDARIKMARERP